MTRRRLVSLIGAATVLALVVGAIVVWHRGGRDGYVRRGPVVATDIGWRMRKGSMTAYAKGTLTLDHGCLRLEPGGGATLIWPSGTRWDDKATAVVLADGTEIEVGDTFSSGGGYVHEESDHDPTFENSEVGRLTRSCRRSVDDVYELPEDLDMFEVLD